ncbi:L-aspartate oxidase [Bacteroidales bacterium OttesenSCG-928-B11]|nr:L-aspartate oxidase [Bacteroidales bacterium OttesenSCG-928-E04]MDL2308234.1 L-aspartate oxidase [Bacteroidales bacterium OttesenSCG-928-C03]MDL2311534.1 L-aspartate oxidase [Bacteroidales bacterium OttesenSCG-928-B11]MDL2325992.1 L-aspartate oxidase [Bacteroidales bacterium OttesenSCG-928-A14]
MRKKVDFLVIGSGIAGLCFALKAANYGNVCVVTKAKIDDTATKYAQGGIAAVIYNPDTYEKHIEDTMVAGDELSDRRIVEITIRESTERVMELVRWGVNFDKTKSGKFALAKEGGHSEFRVLHHKDVTGLEIEQKLIMAVQKHPNIEILEEQLAVEIITQHHLGEEVNRRTPGKTCFGAYVYSPCSQKVSTILSKVTMMASGGIGSVYSNTTNPMVATGDGIAMVYRAKGEVRGMEFVQFHPTSLYNPKESPSFLITEALRGAGAILKDHNGEFFMEKYDPRGSLAPRDIVARAIDTEMKISGKECVFLDATSVKKNEIFNHFPNIYAKCLSIGVDITKDMIPVVPAAHYSCGGITTDEWGQTTIGNLYASGECASTGLHGANRLASNSLLEALVFSHRACVKAVETLEKIDYCEAVPEWDSEGTVSNEEMVLITSSKKEVQTIMSNYVGIVRSNLRLKRAFDRLEIIYRETEELYKKSKVTPEICELRNMINVSYIIIKNAMERHESRGLHYSLDYPGHKERDQRVEDGL